MNCLGVEFVPVGTGALVDGQAYENMVEAWTAFIDRVDAIGRRRIGDHLEAHGYDRFTVGCYIFATVLSGEHKAAHKAPISPVRVPPPPKNKKRRFAPAKVSKAPHQSHPTVAGTVPKV
ncbi:MAG TPA: hypothetical protein GX499_07830 [Clostridiales bacterium]|nr:hypothetical protein [Clostridiales bacterium]